MSTSDFRLNHTSDFNKSPCCCNDSVFMAHNTPRRGEPALKKLFTHI